MNKFTTAFVLLLLFPALATAQNNQPQRNRGYPPKMPDAKTEVYKTIGDVKLNIYIFNPKDHKPTDQRGAIVFFFGGGWRSGSPGQFEQQCKYLVSRGMVAMTADYRVSSRHETKAVDCVEDGKSAIRWVRQNAYRLGIDPKKVASGGGSAGGHVAACTGTIKEFDRETEDSKISSVPDAMVLFNPALVLAPVEGFADFDEARLKSLGNRMGVEPDKLSPYHNIQKGQPPSIIFHGRKDATVPYKTAEIFAKTSTKSGNDCKLVGYDGQGHGFFNYGRGDNEMYIATVREMDLFLGSLGFLEGKPTISE